MIEVLWYNRTKWWEEAGDWPWGSRGGGGGGGGGFQGGGGFHGGSGGGGSGGVRVLTGVTIAAGTYSVDIGGMGSNGTADGQNAQGGDTYYQGTNPVVAAVRTNGGGRGGHVHADEPPSNKNGGTGGSGGSYRFLSL